MSSEFQSGPMKQVFNIGDRVLVSSKCGGWRNDAFGVVCGGPESVQTVQGEDYSYWVQFDTPQHDLSDDGPYFKAQILGRCLSQPPNQALNTDGLGQRTFGASPKPAG